MSEIARFDLMEYVYKLTYFCTFVCCLIENLSYYIVFVYACFVYHAIIFFTIDGMHREKLNTDKDYDVRYM